MNGIIEIVKNTLHCFEIFIIDKEGNPKEGLSIDYVILKSLDNSVIDSGTMEDIDEGIYKFSYTFNIVGQFRIIYRLPIGYPDGAESIMVIEKEAEQASVDILIDMVTRALGLLGEHKRIFDTEFNARHAMTKCRIRIYPTKIDADNDTNHIAEFLGEAEYNTSNEMLSSKIVKLL